jgi:FKBP-type peptidyl-prolyl cis-trans isomerase FkpA
MNKFFKIIILLGFGVLISSCHKTDPVVEVTIRDYAEQYTTDMSTIETYLKTHKMTVATNYDVTFDKTTIPSQSIWGAGTTHGSNLLERSVISNGVTYIIYYIKLRQGDTTLGIKPCNVDAVLAAYKGRLMDDVNVNAAITGSTPDYGTVFDSSDNPLDYFGLDSVIKGWSEIFPQFNSGTYVSNPNGTFTYNDFGAGVMFVPSGLAYFASTVGTIPAYSPLIFNFKFLKAKRYDHDNDGILDYQEDISGPSGIPDGYVYQVVSGVTNYDDTDSDGYPDYLDYDDDGDNFLTKTEIKDPATGLPYPFASIPPCPDGKKKHLSAICH